MKRRIKLSEVIGALEDKGLYKTADHLKKAAGELIEGAMDKRKASTLLVKISKQMLKEITKDMDSEMRTMYKEDAKDLKKAAVLVGKGRFEAAMKFMDGLDTAVRDEIPEAIWRLVDPDWVD